MYAGNCWTSTLIRWGCVALWCLVGLVDRKLLLSCWVRLSGRIRTCLRPWPVVREHRSGKDSSCLSRVMISCPRAISLLLPKLPICLFDCLTLYLTISYLSYSLFIKISSHTAHIVLSTQEINEHMSHLHLWHILHFHLSSILLRQFGKPFIPCTLLHLTLLLDLLKDLGFSSFCLLNFISLEEDLFLNHLLLQEEDYLLMVHSATFLSFLVIQKHLLSYQSLLDESPLSLEELVHWKDFSLEEVIF